MSARVIRVAPRRVREPDPAPVVETLHPELAAPVARQSEPAPAPPPPPAPAPAPAPVNVDFSELAALLRENNDLQRQILQQLQKKKKWSFDLARDAMGRPFQIDATEA